MAEKKITIETAKQEVEITLDKTVQRIDDLGVKSTGLYESLNSLQDIFDAIRGIPDDKRLQYQTLQKMREAWKTQANDIMEEAKKGTANSNPGMNGLEIGCSVITISPSLASGLATCFETLSLGLLAPSLGGIPTLALALAIGSAPIIDPVSLIAAGFIWTSKKVEKDCARDIFVRIYDRNNRAYKRALAEINERIGRIDEEKERIDRGIEIIKGFGTNYKKMTDDQKYELGTYMNLMLSSTQLVVNPIIGLKPYYSDLDFDNYILSLNDFTEYYDAQILKCIKDKKQTWQTASERESYYYKKEAIIRRKVNSIKNKTFLMFLCNFLYRIQLSVNDELVLCKCFKKNDAFVNTYCIDPRDINLELMDEALFMLNVKFGPDQNLIASTGNKKKTPLQKAQDETQEAISKTNDKIIEFGEYISVLSDALNDMQEHLDKVRNLPSEQKLEFERAKEIRLAWKQQAEKIKKDYDKTRTKSASGGIAGVGVGVSVAALGPTAAMGVATTFGVASTGTAISSLSGAAATNAALAWLGGGALAAGGGGMAAGEAFLALAGPIGWSIAGIGILASGIFYFVAKQDQKRLEKIFIQISKRDVKSYELAIVEINERIERIIKESALLKNALIKAEMYGYDYSAMTKKQQYELGSFVNLVSSSTTLLTNPIQGLQPKYTEEDFEHYLSIMHMEGYPEEYLQDKKVIVYLANLLYHVELDDKDKDVLGKSIRSNTDLLKALNTTKKSFDIDYIDLAIKAVKFKYME